MGRPVILCVLVVVACSAAAGYRHLAAFWPEFGPDGPTMIEVCPRRADLAEFEARSRERQEVARAVAAGHLSLDEAVAAFRRIDAALLPGLLANVPGRSPEEKLCRRIIYHVDAIEAESGANEVTVRRLEEELARRLAAGDFSPDPDEQ